MYRPYRQLPHKNSNYSTILQLLYYKVLRYWVIKPSFDKLITWPSHIRFPPSTIDRIDTWLGVSMEFRNNSKFLWIRTAGWDIIGLYMYVYFIKIHRIITCVSVRFGNIFQKTGHFNDSASRTDKPIYQSNPHNFQHKCMRCSMTIYFWKICSLLNNVFFHKTEKIEFWYALHNNGPRLTTFIAFHLCQQKINNNETAVTSANPEKCVFTP